MLSYLGPSKKAQQFLLLSYQGPYLEYDDSKNGGGGGGLFIYSLSGTNAAAQAKILGRTGQDYTGYTFSHLLVRYS